MKATNNDMNDSNITLVIVAIIIALIAYIIRLVQGVTPKQTDSPTPAEPLRKKRIAIVLEALSQLIVGK